jgi:multicomponent Na+:H+ antiporter subunit E
MVLSLVWLGLSGHYTMLLLGMGAASVALVVYLSRRMEVADSEGHPTHLAPRGIRFWSYLLLEIVKSNLDVARRVLTPGKSISPRVIRFKAPIEDEVGRVILANSITLTPGTVTMRAEDGEFEIHALTESAAQDVLDGDMTRRAGQMVGK